MPRYDEAVVCASIVTRHSDGKNLLQIEGRYETLILAEEGIALKIPVGADFIESPGKMTS